MSEKRKLANKQNAMLSTGPKTEAGKSRSKLNAMKHVAYTKMLLDGEDESRFKGMLLDLLVEYKPQGFEENLVIKEIADTIWRKNRFKASEAQAIHAYQVYKHKKDELKGDVAVAIAQDACAYGTITRSLASEDLLDRRLWGLFDRLRKIQKKRGFYPWKSHVSTEEAYSGPGDKTVRSEGTKSSHGVHSEPPADGAIHPGTSNDAQDQRSPARGPEKAGNINQP